LVCKKVRDIKKKLKKIFDKSLYLEKEFENKIVISILLREYVKTDCIKTILKRGGRNKYYI